MKVLSLSSESVFPSIAVEKVRFRSGLKFDENNTLYRTFDPDGPQFVGKPNSAIDYAWKVLLGSKQQFYFIHRNNTNISI